MADQSHWRGNLWKSSNFPSLFWFPSDPRSSTSKNYTLQPHRPQQYEHNIRGFRWTTCQATKNPHDTTTWTLLGLSTVFTPPLVVADNDVVEALRVELAKCKSNHEQEMELVHLEHTNKVKRLKARPGLRSWPFLQGYTMHSKAYQPRTKLRARVETQGARDMSCQQIWWQLRLITPW